MTQELTLYDQFLLEEFLETHPCWRLVHYDDRPVIENGRYIIEGRTLEIAIRRAKKQIEYDRTRYYYCAWCGRR